VLLSSILSGTAGVFDTEVIVPRTSALVGRLSGLGARITPLDISADATVGTRDIATLYRYLKRNTPRLLHSHASLSSRIAGRLLGIPRLISTRHCATARNAASPLRRIFYNRLTDLTVSTADFATRALIGEGVPEGAIVTIKNGSEGKRRLPPEERLKLRDALGIDRDAAVIGMCARVEWVKGQDLLFRAVSGLCQRYNIFLLIVGGGSALYEMKRLCAQHSLLGITHFTGFVDNPHPYQSIFDINVNASRGTETSCLATSECMSLGIPSVVSDFGGNPEMIRHGVSGLIFNGDDAEGLTDALSLLLEDRALYESLSRGARVCFLSDFTREKMNERYISLYRRLLG